MNIEEKLEFTKRKLSEGWSQRKIARELEVDHSTIGYWVKKNFEVVGHQQTSLIRLNELANRNKHQYSYILASYLGDGCISRMLKTYSMRIVCDSKYPDISVRQKNALKALFPNNKVSIYTPKNRNINIVTMYSNFLPEMFPQHDEGKKHDRDVSLHDWQQEIVNREPECFLIGFIDTDGCEYYHTGTTLNMYMFTNKSTHIIDMYCNTLRRLGIEHTSTYHKDGRTNVYVRKRSEVAKIDKIYEIAIEKLTKQ